MFYKDLFGLIVTDLNQIIPFIHSQYVASNKKKELGDIACF